MTPLQQIPFPWKLHEQLRVSFLHRTFAVHCAQRAWAYADTDRSLPVVPLVERYLRGEVSWAKVLEARKQFVGTAQAAMSLGVRHLSPYAAAQVAGWQVAMEDPVQAVNHVMYSTAFAAGFVAVRAWVRHADSLGAPVEGDFAERVQRAHEQNPSLFQNAKDKELAHLHGELQRWQSK
ncbi:MAG: hypothetical protein K2X67_05565 [Burkholderiales bacterium]|jgi:hypothetical protein|nr:hypothetical protein [Burkholderiales bacterium]